MASIWRCALGLAAVSSFGTVGGLKLRQRSKMTTATRIVNGTAVERPLAKYSYFALPTINEESNQWLGCGASIISPTYALTSAHCFGGGLEACSGPKKLAVWVGEVTLGEDSIISSIGPQSFRAEAEVFCNPQFDGKCSHGHDLALLKLQKPIPNWVRPVPLDLGGTDLAAVGHSVTAIGFGLTEEEADRTFIGTQSSRLREVNVSVLGQEIETCARVYEGGFGCSDTDSEGKATNKHQQLCAGATDYPERDTCAGDSGSPLVDASGRQVAIVSYGGGPGDKMSGPGRTCGDPQYPGVYARISAFADFLREHVKDLPGRVDYTEVHT